ncbi:MAG TPA: methylmalonyl-CoA mutase subunit beta [Pseudolabrys sp.]|nr:methylmalonyl-CoA mutase subunit beta [Pseudolabrys sp.]
MTDEPLKLAAEFPPSSAAEWRKLVEAALKGADFDKRLVSRTYDGLRIEPLYARAAAASLVAGRAAVPWQVVQRVDHPEPKAANAEALHDLENGASGLALLFAGAPAARGFGVDIRNLDDLDRALADVMLDVIPLRLETAPFAGRPVATMMIDLAARRTLDPAQLAIDFGLDPIGDMARTGGTILPWPELSQRAGATAKELQAKGFARARLLRADGRGVHDAGGTEAQELAFAIAAGVAYLRLLNAAGFNLDEARRRISFLLAADADEFLTIAKLRALRKLWARIEQASGLAPQPAFVAAETAWRMMTQRDPYVNMLRTTIATAAAGVGGADSVCALPFTLAIGLPDRLARRVARNMQLILLEESNLYRVADPAAGSGGIEALTVGLSQAAWKLFQEIEAAGGAAAALEKGLIQKKVGDTRAARQVNIAKRKDALTGTSDYPNLGEASVKVLDVARVAAPPLALAVTFEPLPSLRMAEPYERLRDASDRFLKKTGARPKVFLANLGTPSDFTARSTFAKNFYEAGGIEALSNDGFKDRAAMLAAFKASGAKLACLCSSDKVYEAQAADAAKALTAAGAIVQLAGRGGDHEAAWRQAGVKTFVFIGCDALSTLRETHGILTDSGHARA